MPIYRVRQAWIETRHVCREGFVVADDDADLADFFSDVEAEPIWDKCVHDVDSHIEDVSEHDWSYEKTTEDAVRNNGLQRNKLPNATQWCRNRDSLDKEKVVK